MSGINIKETMKKEESAGLSAAVTEIEGLKKMVADQAASIKDLMNKPAENAEIAELKALVEEQSASLKGLLEKDMVEVVAEKAKTAMVDFGKPYMTHCAVGGGCLEQNGKYYSLTGVKISKPKFL